KRRRCAAPPPIKAGCDRRAAGWTGMEKERYTKRGGPESDRLKMMFWRRVMKRVLIITTGGTIAMGRDSSGAIRVLDENVLIRQQSALASVAHVDFFTFSNLPSVHLTLDHVIRLRR